MGVVGQVFAKPQADPLATICSANDQVLDGVG
jgi:hypothetical protein